MEENTPEQNNEWKNNARNMIYAMAGFYLLTLAYNMFKAISTTSDMEQSFMIVFTILFTIIGIGLIVFGLSGNYRRSRRRKNEELEEIEDSKESDL